MSLSDKKCLDFDGAYVEGNKYCFREEDVREAVKELKKQIIIHANMWSYMEENQRDIQIKNQFDEIFGEKLC